MHGNLQDERSCKRSAARKVRIASGEPPQEFVAAIAESGYTPVLAGGGG